jgi:Mg2+-importing ATPase
MAFLGPVSSLFDYVTFAVLAFGFGALATPALFQSGWFIESLLSQTLVVHVIRTRRVPFLDSRPSGALVAMSLAICGIGIGLLFSPLAAGLGLVAPPAEFWAALAAILVAYLAAAQLVKAWAVRHWRFE